MAGLTRASPPSRTQKLYTEPVRRRNRENGPPLAWIQLPVRARLRAPQRGRSTAARSHGGRVRTSANGPAAVPPPFPASRAVIASTQWLPPLVERGKGEGENDPRVWGAATVTRFFVLAKTADDRSIVINGRESASPSGPASGPCGRGRGRRGGPNRRPGRWLSGLGPMRRWRSGPWAVFRLWAAQ